MRPARTSLLLLAAGSVVWIPVAAEAQRAGTLIAADPVVDTPPGTQAWRVRYASTDAGGRPTQLTGMVVAPREAMPREPRRVLAWTHGTSGVATRCAPSLSPEFFAATPGLEAAVRRGYVVVAPDYPGLGSAGVHPYLVGEDTARSVLDAVRSAQGIAGAAAGARFAVWGESQGGHAALWTAQRVRNYSPDLTLVGAAAAAPPTDLAENLRSGSDPSIRAFLTAFTAYSWSRHYGAPLSTLGKRSTQGIITRLAQNNCISLTAKPKLGTMLGVAVLRRDLKNVDLGRIQPWAGFARRNSVPVLGFPTPVLIAQNPADKIVGPTVTREFARKTCRAGTRVQFVAIAGKGHETSARDSAEATLRWIDDRFAGQVAPSDCGRI